MADVPPISLPAPIFRHPDGSLDRAANARYAEHVAATWIEHVVVAGPMGAGEFCTSDQRATVVDAWALHHPPERLIVACWEPREIERTLDRGMRALVMLRVDTTDRLFDELAELPAQTIAYTNRRYSRAVLTPAVIDEARGRGVLPSAVKFSKVTLAELAEVRKLAGPDVQVIHGSSRNIAGSLAAGVNIVTSSPLAALPQPWPAPTVEAVQRSADRVQEALDSQHDHSARVAIIADLARTTLDRRP